LIVVTYNSVNYSVTRHMRLFQGFKIKFYSGRLKIYQQ
jgi:hypothetical protein